MIFYVRNALEHFLIVPNTEFNSFFRIFLLGTGLQVDSFFPEKSCRISEEGCWPKLKPKVDVIFSDKKRRLGACAINHPEICNPSDEKISQ